MPLIDEVKAACDRLAPFGWRALILAATKNALDILVPTATDLATRLDEDLLPSDVDRSVGGFEDFAQATTKGVFPGSPGRSLLYHAFSSPGVVLAPDGAALGGFPTPAEIEALENYVFGTRKATIAGLRALVGGDKLTVVVFAVEYRPAKDTPSRLQADLTFSRTGIARVGTAPARYDPSARGFWPEDEADPFAIRVCPARYAAYLAVKVKGAIARPMRSQPGDDTRDFWQPVHKLFPGQECLVGVDVDVTYSAFHLNEKLRRIHTVGLGTADSKRLQSPPFRFADGIAELSVGNDLPPGTLVPVVHPRLVEPARDEEGKFVTFRVPANNGSAFAAFEPRLPDAFRPVPEYVHARTTVDKTGGLSDLNQAADVRGRVASGKYDALHYVDFTGDGQVRVDCPGVTSLDGVASKTVPSYSLVAAPDLFPAVGQRELTEWTETAISQAERDSIWAVPPTPLCDTRVAANLQLPGLSFDPKEVTVTALVTLRDDPPVAVGPPQSSDARRHSALPDDGAGVFAPGWDAAKDKSATGVEHLAAYGLGSPFPEDAKLCAALSTFWPAVAPDVARTFLANTASRRGTAAPLVDDEIGQVSGVSWDGIAGPLVVDVGGILFLEGADFLHADYVEEALNGRWSIRITASVTTAEYTGRTRAMARAHRALPVSNRNAWFVISFRRVSPGDPELVSAQGMTSVLLAGPVFRIDLCRLVPATPVPTDVRRARMPINDRRLMFASAMSPTVLFRPISSTVWSAVAT